MTLFVIENIDKDHRRKLFTIFGTDYTVSNRGWLNPVIMIVVGAIIGLLIAPVEDTPIQLLVGAGYGVLIFMCGFLHGVGHIISSRMADAPMDALTLTLTVNITSYNDEGKTITSNQHLIRAIGGPLMNLVLCGVCLLIYAVVIQCTFVAFFAGINLAFLIVTLLPIPTVDGAVIWRELIN